MGPPEGEPPPPFRSRCLSRSLTNVSGCFSAKPPQAMLLRGQGSTGCRRTGVASRPSATASSTRTPRSGSPPSSRAFPLRRAPGAGPAPAPRRAPRGPAPPPLPSGARSARQKEAARRRQSATAADGLTVCQTHSVRPATLRLYDNDYASFRRWLKANGHSMSNGEAGCDHVLSLFLDTMYLDGAHLSLGQRMFASVLFFRAGLSKAGGARMPLCRRALKGWKRLAPAGSRLGIPFEVMSMLVMWMWYHNLWEEGLLTWLTFEMYYRPNEPLSLRAQDLVPPVTGARAGTSWSLNLHRREHAVASKTEEFDEAMQLDLERQVALGPALAAILESRYGPHWRQAVLKRSAAPPPLFTIGADDAVKAFNRAVKALKLGSVGVTSRYQLRHGGASHDAATAARTLEQIRHRGRWRSQSSLRRYEKGARLGEVLERLAPKVRAHALRCADSLGDVAAKRRPPFASP